MLKTRRATARLAAANKDFKPSFLSSDDWQRVKDELRAFPNRWEQQKEANRVQQETTGISRLGSGGRANFTATFVNFSCLSYLFIHSRTTLSLVTKFCLFLNLGVYGWENAVAIRVRGGSRQWYTKTF